MNILKRIAAFLLLGLVSLFVIIYGLSRCETRGDVIVFLLLTYVPLRISEFIDEYI